MNSYTTYSTKDGKQVAETERYARNSGRLTGKTVSESGTNTDGNQYAEKTKYNSRGKAVDSSYIDYGQNNKKKIAQPLYEQANGGSNISIVPSDSVEPLSTSYAQPDSLGQMANGANSLNKLNSINKFDTGNNNANIFGNSPVSGDSLIPSISSSLSQSSLQQPKPFTSTPLASPLSSYNTEDLIPRKNGGPVIPGEEYRVGENGEEKFVPDVPGVIVPNSQRSEEEQVPGGDRRIRVNFDDGMITMFGGNGETKIPISEVYRDNGVNYKDLSQQEAGSLAVAMAKDLVTQQYKNNKGQQVASPKTISGDNVSQQVKNRNNQREDWPKTNSMGDIEKRHNMYSSGNPNRVIASKTDIIQNGRITPQYFTYQSSYSGASQDNSPQSIRKRLADPSSYSRFLLNPGYDASKGETALYSIPLSTSADDFNQLKAMSNYDQEIAEAESRNRLRASQSEENSARALTIPIEIDSKKDLNAAQAESFSEEAKRTRVINAWAEEQARRREQEKVEEQVRKLIPGTIAPAHINEVKKETPKQKTKVAVPRATPLSQYTNTYKDFSSSILGQLLGLPGTNNLIDESLTAADQIGSGLATVGNFLTKPRQR